jgi:hypothetical protein
MNDLDSTTAGYDELASPTANWGEGWWPIGSFRGTFDGQGYEIRDLFINLPEEGGVALFASVDDGGRIENIGLVNAKVTGGGSVGGLVGFNYEGTVSNSYSMGSVTSDADCVGGLVGCNEGTVSRSFSNCSVTGYRCVGGLVGINGYGTISDSYSTGTVAGQGDVGGLVGYSYHDEGTSPECIVSNSYSTGNVTGEGHVGGLMGHNSRSTISNSYSTGSVTGESYVGGLVGSNYHDGGTGPECIVSNSYSTGSVTGDRYVGGLVGSNMHSTISNSYYNYDDVLINGENIISIGAMFGEDFDEWLANDRFLDVNDRLSQEDGYYPVNNVTDFQELLAFGQDATLKFKLKSDLDLGDEPNFYIPYLAGEFDGNGYKISSLSFSLGFVAHIGLFGYLAPGGRITDLGVETVNITGCWTVGGLVGVNYEGTVSNSYSMGSVTSDADCVGGLVGYNCKGTVSRSYSNCSVTGKVDVGGLTGRNAGWWVGNTWQGIVIDSYSTSNVTGDAHIGGLVGVNDCGIVNKSYSIGSVTGNSNVGGMIGIITNGSNGTVSDSFWDIETSGQATSAGGTGKTTEEMQDNSTFSGVGWSIITVGGPGERNPAYVWNIVNNVTYPFLSWQT